MGEINWDELKKMEEELKTSYTGNITCPYCGYEDTDSWETGDEEYGEIQCPDCEKEFYYNKHISVTYSTGKLNDDNES